jgi:hypothetical protein
VKWRITYLFKTAERAGDGWIVYGEAGLGPPAEGDEFSFIHHHDTAQDDEVALRVETHSGSSMRLITAETVELKPGDILGGEVQR